MTDAYAGPAANGPRHEGSSRGSTGRSATPFHCPFCGDEDLRPAEDSPAAWTCRSCARVFTVSLLRLDQGAIPSNVTATEGGTT